MKKKLFVLAIAVIILAGMATGTLAYYTSKAVAHNVITSGEIDIDLVETKLEGTEEVPYPTDPADGIMPGHEVSKIVRIHNVGSNPAWVRIKVDVTVEDANGADLGAENLAINYHTEDADLWTYANGYYYYEQVLAPGAETTPLFDTVILDTSTGNNYQNATISIDVQAHGIQYQNNDIPAGGTITDVWPSGIAILPLI